MQIQRRRTLLGAMTALAMAGGMTTASAQAFDAEAYFKGKTIEVVINAGAGGGLDTSTRFVLQGFSDYIPGNPRINATNIEEIPGIDAVYDAPVTDDRITIGFTTRAATLYNSMLDAAATHDAKKMQVAAGFGGNPGMTLIFNEAAKAYGSIKDASGSKAPELVFAEMVGDASGVVSSAFYVSWLCDTFDLPCRMVKVADANSTLMAQDVMRGQINMMDANSVSLIRLFADKLTSGEAKVFGEYTEEGASTIESPYPRPDIREALPTDEAKKEFDAILPLIAYGGIANAIFAGPNVPPEAVNAIGDAFVKKMSEPANVEQTVKARFGDFAGHSFTPSVIGPADAQRIYEVGMAQFDQNQQFYKTKQKELYKKYWQ